MTKSEKAGAKRFKLFLDTATPSFGHLDFVILSSWTFVISLPNENSEEPPKASLRAEVNPYASIP
jgi:hypothetical protein